MDGLNYNRLTELIITFDVCHRFIQFFESTQQIKPDWDVIKAVRKMQVELLNQETEMRKRLSIEDTQKREING